MRAARSRSRTSSPCAAISACEMAPPATADPGFEQRVTESFAHLRFMSTIGARLVKVAAGAVDIDMAVRDDLTQQHGYLAAGVVTALVDTACGYAAMSLMPAGQASSPSSTRSTSSRPRA